MTFKSKKHRPVGIFTLLLAGFFIQPAQAQNTQPTVIELFTSKGCPACPPADQNLKTLQSTHPNAITLSCHVTYFNKGRAGDIFANKMCDSRQAVYKFALKQKHTYTPMMVVNGQNVTNGKDLKKTGLTLANSSQLKTGPIVLSRNGQYLDIRLPSLPLNQPADVWLFEYLKAPNQSGYTHYRNTVSKITKIMRWSGNATNMAFPVNPGLGKGFAVIVQNYKNGIIAAGKTD